MGTLPTLALERQVNRASLSHSFRQYLLNGAGHPILPCIIVNLPHYRPFKRCRYIHPVYSFSLFAAHSTTQKNKTKHRTVFTMYAYASVSTALAATVFAGFAAASHPAPMSHNVSQFKMAYEEIGIVPEVVSGIDPSLSFYFGYLEEDGDPGMMMPGMTISLFEAQQLPFEWLVEGLENVTEADAETRYLIYIADVDAPDRDTPSPGVLRHYLCGNFTLSGASTLLPETAQTLVSNSTPFTPFTNPDPQLGTGVHRFLSAIYIQPTQFNTIDFGSAMPAATSNWSLSEWRTQLSLGPAIGATVWNVNTTDEGTLNSAPGVAPPMAMLGSFSALMFTAFALL